MPKEKSITNALVRTLLQVTFTQEKGNRLLTFVNLAINACYKTYVKAWIEHHTFLIRLYIPYTCLSVSFMYVLDICVILSLERPYINILELMYNVRFSSKMHFTYIRTFFDTPVSHMYLYVFETCLIKCTRKAITKRNEFTLLMSILKIGLIFLINFD